MQLKLTGIVLLVQLLFALQMPTAVSATQAEETQLKAVFVLNFAKSAEWPADSLAINSLFTIAILGKAPSSSFINLLKEQKVHGIGVTVKLVDNVRQAKGSQLLYISSSERQHLPAILSGLRQNPILTVSDMPAFCEAGGMIGLVPVQNRLSFEVNLAAVRKANLSVSSQLLKLSKEIYGQ